MKTLLIWLLTTVSVWAATPMLRPTCEENNGVRNCHFDYDTTPSRPAAPHVDPLPPTAQQPEPEQPPQQQPYYRVEIPRQPPIIFRIPHQIHLGPFHIYIQTQ